MTQDEFYTFKNHVLQCTKCELSRTRKSVIFGEGNEHAELMLIAEAPGRDEDIQGRPFVGKSGQLLDKILLACGFNRNKHIYISNIIKCRPPDNRTPERNQVQKCIPYLFKQIDYIDPKMILLLGATSLKYIMGDQYRITRVHGQWLNWEKRLVMPVFHPSALLRNPALKKNTWEDYKKVIGKYRELIDKSHYSPHV